MAEADVVVDRYPDLEPDLASAFQRLRVESAARRVALGARVLDVGCNSGYFKRLCPQAAHVAGVDINPELVALAALRLDEACLAPAEALPFGDRSFDVVVLSSVFEHVDDCVAVLKEATRVARGRLLGCAVATEGSWGTLGGRWHKHAFTEASLLELLLPFGVVEIWPIKRGTITECWGFQVAY